MFVYMKIILQILFLLSLGTDIFVSCLSTYMDGFSSISSGFLSLDPPKWYEIYFIPWTWMDLRSKTSTINSCWDMVVTPINRKYYLKVEKCWFFFYIFWIFKSRPTKMIWDLLYTMDMDGLKVQNIYHQ